MFRFAEIELNKWRKNTRPQPLMLRGARQVGKTYLIETFAQANFKNYVYINFEYKPEYKKIFIDNDPRKILERIFQLTGIKITIGDSIIFLDEVQDCPEAITAMRYFYEQMPGLHVVAAGSLLEFLLNSGRISIPVGRVEFLFLKPMSFYEYLIAKHQGDRGLVEQIQNADLASPLDDFSHELLLREIEEYAALGGMPAVVEQYLANPTDLIERQEQVNKTLSAIIYGYRKDFGKYANFAKHKYLEAVFTHAAMQAGKKFMYARVDPELDAQEIKKAYELLVQANIFYQIKRTSVQEPALAANASNKFFKSLFLDVGIMAKIMDFNPSQRSTVNGAVAEQLVGQELLAKQALYEEPQLYYWARETSSSSAEVDFLSKIAGQTVPIEVKAGKQGGLKSLKIVMAENKIKTGIKISSKPLTYDGQILSVPFYAIAEIDRLLTGV